MAAKTEVRPSGVKIKTGKTPGGRDYEIVKALGVGKFTTVKNTRPKEDPEKVGGLAPDRYPTHYKKETVNGKSVKYTAGFEGGSRALKKGPIKPERGSRSPIRPIG